MSNSKQTNQDANGNSIISKDDNGIVWVSNHEGVVFGIVSTMQTTDCDGIPYDGYTISILERNGFEFMQDWVNESTYIDFSYDNGEVSRLSFENEIVRLEAQQ